MVRKSLWAVLSLSAVFTNGIVLSRARSDVIDLAALISQSREVRGHKKNILGGLQDGLPYSEGPLASSKAVQLDPVRENERKCITLRNFVKPQGYKSVIDVVPHIDHPDQLTGKDEVPIEITQSVAVIDGSRLGWNRESSTEAGISVTAEAAAGIGAFSASLSSTVFGNQRWTDGQNGEQTAEKEFRNELQTTRKCPPHSICRVVTWTYTRTITGTCFLAPFLDMQCIDPGRTGKYSLGLFPSCEPAAGVASQFFAFDYDRDMTASGFGPDLQGVKMHRPEAVKRNKYEETCSFSYVLRWPQGDPVRAQAVLAVPLDDEPEVNKSFVTRVPKAIKWRYGKKQTFCELENNWFWQPEHEFFIPASQGGNGKWQTRMDLPRPDGLDEKCPESARLLARAKDEDELPPANLRFLIDMIIDEVPAFLSALGQSHSAKISTGPVANSLLVMGLEVDEPVYTERPVDGSEPKEDSIKECLKILGSRGGMPSYQAR
ncbi:hypothetical protein NOR_07521 [Metarhizium rileyi]|uniref:Uncharacterized protein n=1 Tax=Metarhizium rileyi (strain RCEF 4871) TaxID=1649241 RepID=A0A166Y240_METRR|nr:hypothetical protein NOR_07521 [Metarhizium rileyi RCEF 4871]